MDRLKSIFLVAIIIVAVSVTPVRLDDECEAFSIVEKFSKAAKSDFNQDQKSLLIAFDGTMSMTTDLNQLRAGAKEITLEFANRHDNPIYDYILSVFRDPVHGNTDDLPLNNSFNKTESTYIRLNALHLQFHSF